MKISDIDPHPNSGPPYFLYPHLSLCLHTDANFRSDFDLESQFPQLIAVLLLQPPQIDCDSSTQLQLWLYHNFSDTSSHDFVDFTASDWLHTGVLNPLPHLFLPVIWSWIFLLQHQELSHLIANMIIALPSILLHKPEREDRGKERGGKRRDKERRRRRGGAGGVISWDLYLDFLEDRVFSIFSIFSFARIIWSITTMKLQASMAYAYCTLSFSVIAPIAHACLCLCHTEGWACHLSLKIFFTGCSFPCYMRKRHSGETCMANGGGRQTRLTDHNPSWFVQRRLLGYKNLPCQQLQDMKER